MKRFSAFLLVTVLLLGVFAGCGKKELSETPLDKPTRLQLAGGQVSVKLPEGYYNDSSAPLASDQIGRYSCPDNYTLEVFQKAKSGNASLQSVADALATELDTKAFKVTVGDNLFMCYTYQKDVDGRMFTVANYVVAAKQCFLVLTFHTDGSHDQMVAIGEFLEEVQVH